VKRPKFLRWAIRELWAKNNWDNGMKSKTADQGVGKTKGSCRKRTKVESYIDGKRERRIKSASLRARESQAKVASQFNQIRTIPGFENATKTDILVAAQRVLSDASFRDTESLLYYSLHTFLEPLHYSVGKWIEMAKLREDFFGIVESADAVIAAKFRSSPEAFDSFALGRLEGLRPIVEQNDWGIKRINVLADGFLRPTRYKVELKNGRAFSCVHTGVTCLEPHVVFAGNREVLKNHADAILGFVQSSSGEPGDLRFDLTEQDQVHQLTLYNVAWIEDPTTVEMLIKSAISTYVKSLKR
jgi:hypothetical protein